MGVATTVAPSSQGASARDLKTQPKSWPNGWTFSLSGQPISFFRALTPLKASHLYPLTILHTAVSLIEILIT